MTIDTNCDPRQLKNLLRSCKPEQLTMNTILALREEISQFLFMSDVPAPTDLCVVLGSPSFTNVDPAISLFNAGFTKYILITGYGPKVSVTAEGFKPEYERLRQRALQAGVPATAILVERNATNTLENFLNSSKIVESQFGWKNLSSVAIASKPLHMRRAFLTACKNWPANLKLVLQPTQSTQDLQADNWWQRKEGQKRVLNELRSIIKYSTKGDIEGV